nr:hypothetical protein [uncultured Flavobacterium sp.]
MKKLLFLFLLSFSVKAQVFILEKNPNWDKYQVVIEKKTINNSEHVFQLKNGQVSAVKLFYDDELTTEFKPNFDENSNLKSLEIKFPNKSLNEVQLIDYELKYNKNGLRIEDNNHKYVFDKHERLIQRFTKLFEESKGTKSWSESYFYNEFGDLIRIEKTSTEKGIQYIDVEEFVYDDCKNIKQITRNSTPERNYPLIVLGGEIKDKTAIYEYEYNEDCIWIKKYLVTNDSKALLISRELIK